MKKSIIILGLIGLALVSCKKNETITTDSATTTEAVGPGQEAVQDDDSNPNVVQLAAKNPDLSTLVTAVKTANLTTSLSNAGPFTVFAPLN
ncbi:MAG: fasciclin domain-containing protein, partial [Kaistella sp.]